MELPEHLCAGMLERLHEERVRMRQHQHEKVNLAQHPALAHQRLPHIHLRRARIVEQRHEHLPLQPPQLAHLLPHLGVAPAVALLHQPLEDALRSMALLLRHRAVLGQDLRDALHIRPQLERR
ncbi:MAG: hypothetical protein HQ559_16060 [Lentisphaerae bacterium]|nr:hypothetical protein [Lentisphaerota bacterium]